MMRKTLPWMALLWALTASACGTTRAPSFDAARANPEVWLSEGARSAERGDLVRAEQYLMEATKAGVPIERLLPLLLRVCVRSGRQRRALAHVRAALRQSPSDPHLWALAGTFAWAIGDLEEAARLLETAGEMTHAPAEVEFWKARVAISAGALERGSQHLEAYLTASPDGRFSSWARIWMKREKGV